MSNREPRSSRPSALQPGVVVVLALVTSLSMGSFCSPVETELDTAAQCVGGSNDGDPCVETVTDADCPGGVCLAQSHVAVNQRLASPALTPPVQGTTIVNCGLLDKASGTRSCACRVGEIEPIALPMGVGCVEPILGCPAGITDCDGGTPLSQSVVRDHDVANCGLGDDPEDPPTEFQGPAECAASCTAYCGALPGNYTHLASACQGYCEGGDNEGEMCDFDAECTGGYCAGTEAVSAPNTCNCECVEVGGSPSPAGAMACNMGMRVRVEDQLPCDGLDVQFTRDLCVPLTTETASSVLHDADLMGATITTGPIEGQHLACADIAASDTKDLVLAGSFAMLDTSEGDLEIALKLSNADEIRAHSCDLAFGPSRLTYNFPDINPLPDPMNGDFELDCGAPDPVTGLASCTCSFGSLEPFGIGTAATLLTLCMAPFDGCPARHVACDGGSAADVDYIRHHDVGHCGLVNPAEGNSECATKCQAYCATQPGGPYTMIDSGCEGYCKTGINEGMACSFDFECAQGGPGAIAGCIGGEPVAHRNDCNCECARYDGNSASGALGCEMGTTISLELSPPCFDGDTQSQWNVCVPLTTEQVTAALHQANKTQQSIVPDALFGARKTCADLDAGDLSGLRLVGSLGLMDGKGTNSGDHEVGIALQCQ